MEPSRTGRRTEARDRSCAWWGGPAVNVRAGNAHQVYAVGTPGHYRMIVGKVHVEM